MEAKNYTKSEIESLIKRFEARKLPKVEWTHPAHIVVAVWYTVHHGEEEALDLVREFIKNHNEAVGTGNTDFDGYHETITKFWLWVAGQFLAGRKHEPIDILCNGLITSEFGKSSHPLMYYSKELLFSVKARHRWVNPDVQSLNVLIGESQN
ncbi:MAG: hypothetical protein V4642_04630 [Bacteroidota bacterium]